jgi:Na+/H+ antiporter NhaD/arsenite permease-like protein
MLSPANTVVFDEPLRLPSTEASRSDTFNSTPLSQQSTAVHFNSQSFSSLPLLSSISDLLHRFSTYLSKNYPTFHTALPRLPFALVPFAFSQFILIEGLSRQGWIDIFAQWLVIVTKREMFKTVWVVGVLGVLLCNASGTNIGATILLTKIVNTAALSYVPPSSGPEVNIKTFLRSAAIALAVASNIGAVSFTFSASLAGLLWRQILLQKEITVAQKTFARWNLGPIVVMTVVGLAVVSAEMAVLY